MAEVLKMLQFIDYDCVTKVQIRRRGVEPQLYAQLAARRKLFREFWLAYQLVAAAPYGLNGLLNG